MKAAKRLLEIDALRAVGAFIILVQHTSQIFAPIPGTDPLAKTIHDWMAGIDIGRSAVVWFFAISGYVICYSLKGDWKSGSIDFWGRRLFRLYPVFWLSIAVALVLMWMPAGKEITPQLVLANITMLPKFFGQDNVIGVYWTLEVDLVFYFLCWLMFCSGQLQNPKLLGGIIVSLILLQMFFAFRRDLAPTYHYWLGMPYHLSIMFWASLLQYYHSNPDAKVRFFNLFGVSSRVFYWTLTVIMFIPTTLVFLLYLANDDGQALRNSVSYMIGMVTFVLFTTRLPMRSQKLADFGNYTYAIYLFHLIFIVFMAYLVENHFRFMLDWSIFFYFAVVFVLSTVTGHVIFNYVERPFMKYSQDKFSRHRWQAKFQAGQAKYSVD